MDIKIYPARLEGVVKAIPSKSQAHRALICAALADAPTRIECEGGSEDISATAACLAALGAGIERDSGGYTVIPACRGERGAEYCIPCEDAGNGEATDGVVPSLPCGESGSTFRFLLPIVGALGLEASFMLKGRLPQRPLSPLYEELINHGCALSPQGTVPFSAAGQLAPGSYVLDGGVSSQFVSGLLFALPLLEGDSELRLTGCVESFPYIEMTVAMQEAFGVKTTFDGATFTIPGRQTYRSPGNINVEGDWSNASFWLSAGAIGTGAVSCSGLDPQSRQGDRAIIDILSRFGAKVEWAGSRLFACSSHGTEIVTTGEGRNSINSSVVTVTGGNLRGIDIDAKDIPDLVPILAVVATAADGTTTIKNASRLRTKESDRLAAIVEVLRTLGANITETEDGLIITSTSVTPTGVTPTSVTPTSGNTSTSSTLTGGTVSSHGDHRIAMSAAIAATLCTEPVTIQGAEAVNKSYPRFFDDLWLLGGKLAPNP